MYFWFGQAAMVHSRIYDSDVLKAQQYLLNEKNISLLQSSHLLPQYNQSTMLSSSMRDKNLSKSCYIQSEITYNGESQKQNAFHHHPRLFPLFIKIKHHPRLFPLLIKIKHEK
ncbi:hypothetical protein O6H91_07G135600 [Diphasiastrum complanatum]|uniref:Uncharacterized protein n=1 Tax=Diphasiastrum complanatum TaxID=34168 RepID=A0ACC2DA91_DIPCM|nr:hypothetical protein O6H91_07G135600 [Diphasiastrum complanatum]